jgi:dihydroxyacetone kinase-like protein
MRMRSQTRCWQHVLPELATRQAGDQRGTVLVNSLGRNAGRRALHRLPPLCGQVLAERGVAIVRIRLIGRYATSMEMAGASLSVMKLDAELEALLAAPAECPFWSVL